MKDKYDLAIEYLTKHPSEIDEAWLRTQRHPAGALFSFTGDGKCGCLTQIRQGLAVAPTEELTSVIKCDERIPASHRDITVEHLPVFAEWQRRLDKELNRA